MKFFFFTIVVVVSLLLVVFFITNKESKPKMTVTFEPNIFDFKGKLSEDLFLIDPNLNPMSLDTPHIEERFINTQKTAEIDENDIDVSAHEEKTLTKFTLSDINEKSLSIVSMNKLSDKQLLRVLDPTVEFFTHDFVRENVSRYRKIISSVYRKGRSTAAEQALKISFNNRMYSNNVSILCSPKLCSVLALPKQILRVENVKFDKKIDCKDFHISMRSCSANMTLNSETNQTISAYEANVLLKSGEFLDDQVISENYQFKQVNNSEGILRQKVEQFVLIEILKQQTLTMKTMVLNNLKCSNQSCNLVVENAYYEDVNEFESVELRVVYDDSGKEILRRPALPDFPLWQRVKKHNVHYEIGDWPAGMKPLLDLSPYCKSTAIYLSGQPREEGIVYQNPHFQCRISL